MGFHLIDACRVEYDAGIRPFDDGHIRGNGDRVVVSRWEKVPMKMTLSDGSEVEEEVYTGRTMQVDTILGAEVRDGKRGEMVITGRSQFQADQKLPEEQQSVTVRIIPDATRCTSCG